MAMHEYQREFLDLAIAAGALRFGEFTLKSGRRSPYFFNAGAFHTGDLLGRLAHCYAEAILESGVEFDVLFGPAYKGIPLAAATSVLLAREFGRDLPYAFNRKEAKDHGEGGWIIGSPLRGKVLIIDDVISAGTSVRESIATIRAAGASAVAVAIALDRQERGSGARSAVQEVEEDLGLHVVSVASLADLLEYLERERDDPVLLERVRAYRQTYGVESAPG
jgi:orotate phosphoribosyltransferase